MTVIWAETVGNLTVKTFIRQDLAHAQEKSFKVIYFLHHRFFTHQSCYFKISFTGNLRVLHHYSRVARMRQWWTVTSLDHLNDLNQEYLASLVGEVKQVQVATETTLGAGVYEDQHGVLLNINYHHHQGLSSSRRLAVMMS